MEWQTFKLLVSLMKEEVLPFRRLYSSFKVSIIRYCSSSGLRVKGSSSSSIAESSSTIYSPSGSSTIATFSQIILGRVSISFIIASFTSLSYTFCSIIFTSSTLLTSSTFSSLIAVISPIFSAFSSRMHLFSTFLLIFISDFHFPESESDLQFLKKDISNYIQSFPAQIQPFTVLELYIHITMTKFFIPVPRGAPKGFAHPQKQKKKGGSTVATLQKKVVQVLKKLLTRQIQKTIRKLHEQTEESEKQKLVGRLEQYKKVGKAELKQLSYFIMTQELNVETQSIKKNFKIVPVKEAEQLPEQLQLFYQAIKGKNVYRGEIEDAQKIKNTVSEKKKIKKERAKLKKKAKVAIKKERGEAEELDSSVQKEEEGEEEESMEVQASEEQKPSTKNKENDSTERFVEKIALGKQSFKAKEEPIRLQKTQFKKTGRNKFLQEKRNQKKGFPRQDPHPQPLPQKPAPSAIPGRHQTPHPSWQAKREIKNQMFLQPFEGKRTIL